MKTRIQNTFPLEEEGYVTHYLYTGRKETECKDDSKDTNQLRYEKYLRGKLVNHLPMTPPENIRLGQDSPIGVPWKYYYSYGNVFLEDSSFFAELCKIEMHAATALVSNSDRQVKACIWSCCAVDLWVNGELAGTVETPVYKPIQRVIVSLPLRKGRNELYLRLETAGVRDTRISVALQLLEGTETIRVALPGMKEDNQELSEDRQLHPYIEAEYLLNSAQLTEDKLIFSSPLLAGSKLIYDTGTIDFYKRKERFLEEAVGGMQEILLKDYSSLQITIPLQYSRLSRRFEQTQLCRVRYLTSSQRTDLETAKVTEHQREIFHRIGTIRSLPRSNKDGFSLYPLLARYYEGKRLASDEEELMITLNQIERRMDCADFMTCALIRFMRNYEYSDAVAARIKEVMLNFRYWMDQDGQDGMCFWSENHTLMFYQTAYFFGQEYPDEIFVRSGLTGRELMLQARQNLNDWFEDVCTQGFDEFNSGVYSSITFAAILNVVDYGEPSLQRMAKEAADLLLRRVAVHCFRNIIISPQGRVYRDVLYPGRQGLQSIVNFVCPNAPYVYNEWLISLATSAYRIPEDFTRIMQQTGFCSYSTSNAVIDLYKTNDYMLTSVQSPRRDGIVRVWERNEKEQERKCHSYTKTLNECFHGTMQFEPGVFGYQQHMWYAALSEDVVVFANHPGGTCEDMAEVRPGYWFGNGIMPALRQEGRVLGSVYVIPETFTVHFTHLYWNSRLLQETQEQAGWLFGRFEDSYIGIWCNRPFADHNDVMYGCEKRSYGEEIAYLAVCGSKVEDGSFDAFLKGCLSRHVAYEESTHTLACEEFNLCFEAHQNQSQYVE